jgi:hypothetical protein
MVNYLIHKDKEGKNTEELDFQCVIGILNIYVMVLVNMYGLLTKRHSVFIKERYE